MDKIHLEELAMNAWPALQTVLYDGWIIRLAKGYTKRANSVTPLYPSTLPWLDEKIHTCEQLFQKEKLRPTFRLSQATVNEQRGLSLSKSGLRQAQPSSHVQPSSSDDTVQKKPAFTDIGELDSQLEKRGYERIDTTSVQTVDLYELDVEQSHRAYLLPDYSGMESWLSSFHTLSGDHRTDDVTHKEMLANIKGETGYMVLMTDDGVVACGLGVVERGYLGIFDVVTDPNHRNRGYGTELMQSLLAWGKQCDADFSSLQVMTNNPAALNLYAKLGYKEQYQYWYRVLN